MSSDSLNKARAALTGDEVIIPPDFKAAVNVEMKAEDTTPIKKKLLIPIPMELQIYRSKRQHNPFKYYRTLDMILLTIRSLRSRGIEVNVPPISKMRKKQLSGYWSYLKQIG